MRFICRRPLSQRASFYILSHLRQKPSASHGSPWAALTQVSSESLRGSRARCQIETADPARDLLFCSRFHTKLCYWLYRRLFGDIHEYALFSCTSAATVLFFFCA